MHDFRQGYFRGGNRKVGEFYGLGSMYGVESCKVMFPGGTSYSLVQTFLL